MKKTAIAMLLVLVLLVSLAGCAGQGASSGFKDIEVISPSGLESATIEAPDYNPGDIESATIESQDSGLGEVETVPVDGLESATIKAPSFDFGDIEPISVADLEPVTIQVPKFDFPEIKTIPIGGLESVTIKMPTYNFKEITVKGVDLSIPEVDYEISSDKIGSAYSNTYTVPDLTIDIPDFDDQALKEAYVSFADNLSPEDQAKLAKMSDEEVAEVMSVQLSMKELLFSEFEAAGITLAIDPITGSVPIDASLLFDTNKYELKPDGKDALKAFFTIYESVITKPEYKGLVKTILIEGHTDTQGSYESNLKLSEQRAQAVVDFLLSDECGLTQRSYIKSLLKTVGRSYDDPVYAADGTVDLAASRRVEIHFTLNLG